MFLEEQVTPGAFLFIACTWKWTKSFISVISSLLHKSTQLTYCATRISSYLSYFYLIVTQIHPVNVLCHQDLFLPQLFLSYCYTNPPSQRTVPPESLLTSVISTLLLHKSTQSTYCATRISSYLSYFYLIVTQIHPVDVLCHQDLFLSQLFSACYTDPPSQLPKPSCSHCTALSGYLNLSSR